MGLTQTNVYNNQTPINLKSKEKGYSQKQLISYVKDENLKQFIFKGHSNITQKQYENGNYSEENLDLQISYSTLDGHKLVSFDSGTYQTKNSNKHTNSSKTQRCTPDNWEDCVEGNLSGAGGAELPGCMVLGSWCAAGIAAGCAVDTYFEINRPVYC